MKHADTCPTCGQKLPEPTDDRPYEFPDETPLRDERLTWSVKAHPRDYLWSRTDLKTLGDLRADIRKNGFGKLLGKASRENLLQALDLRKPEDGSTPPLVNKYKVKDPLK